MECLTLTSLETNLYDPFADLDRLGHGAALADVISQRLLAVDIQPMLQAGDQMQRVPVGWTGDDNHVQIGFVQHLGVQLERLRPLALQLLQFARIFFQVLAIHVADRRYLDAADLESCLGIHHAVPSDTNHGHFQRLARISLLAVYRTLQRQSPGCRCSAQEGATSGFRHSRFLFYGISGSLPAGLQVPIHSAYCR